MATSHYKTTVQNSGNMNKGGSKIINRYKDGGLVSTKTVRGSPDNKSGGANNQYSTQVYTIDKPSSQTSRSSRPIARNRSSTDSGNSELGATLVLGALGIIAAVFAAIGYGIYKFVCWCIGKFTHN